MPLSSPGISAGQVAAGAAGMAKKAAGKAAGHAATTGKFAAGTAGAALGTAGAALGTAKAAFDAQRPEMVSKAILGKELAKAKLLDISAPVRRGMLSSLKQMIKDQSIADPDMWQCVKAAICSILDYVFADVEWELERTLEAALLKQKYDEDADSRSGGALDYMCCLCRGFRTCVLHHYLPHNRSIFGKMKDCIWWLITIITILPVYGVRVCTFSLILLMLLFPTPPDEFQLINFILIFKGTQFFTSGFLATVIGAARYFVCFSWFKDDLLGCIETAGPGAFESLWGELADYLGSILLVWIAFCALPCSEKVEHTAYLGHSRRKEEFEDEGQGCLCCATSRGGAASKRGGRLRMLLWYDMVSFIISAIVLVALTAATCWNIFKEDGLQGVIASIQFTANIYWSRVLYALLSLPFSIFIIPVLNTLLTHSDPTGYNAQGECVPFALPADGGMERGVNSESAEEVEQQELLEEDSSSELEDP